MKIFTCDECGLNWDGDTAFGVFPSDFCIDCETKFAAKRVSRSLERVMIHRADGSQELRNVKPGEIIPLAAGDCVYRAPHHEGQLRIEHGSQVGPDTPIA